MPSIAARSAGHALGIADTAAIDTGLPVACTTELGAARVLEHRLRKAADIPTKRSLKSGLVGTKGKRCVRIPVPHQSAYLDDTSTGGSNLPAAWA